MTTILENNKLPILSIFSFKYKDESKELEWVDKCKVVAAFVVGLLLGVIGSPIVGLATSYYLRSRRIEQLKLTDEALASVAKKCAKAASLIKTAASLIETQEREECAKAASLIETAASLIETQEREECAKAASLIETAASLIETQEREVSSFGTEEDPAIDPLQGLSEKEVDDLENAYAQLETSPD